VIIETIGVIALLLGVTGVILNNRKFRICFIVWFVGTMLTASIHASAGIWSLFGKDLIFLVLSVEGWYRWKKSEIGLANNKQRIIDRQAEQISDLARRLLSHRKGESVKATCDVHGDFWYVDDETIVCPRCMSE